MPPLDEQMMRALQAFFMSGQTLPMYYPTGPSPTPYAPELDPFVQNVFSTGSPLDVNSKGEPVPFGLDTAKSLMNFNQDMLGGVADPMNAYMASLFGGGGEAQGFAPGVFDPIAKRTPIEAIQAPQLALMAQAGGLEGTIAELILSGKTAAQAAAEVRNIINKPEDYGRSQEDADMLRAQVPPTVNNIGQEAPDWGALNRIAADLYTPYLKEQATLNAPGVETDEMGRYFATEMVDSPQMEWAKKLGLPDPRAQYDLQYALENDPTIAGLFQQRVESGAAADAMRKTLDQYTKKLTKQRENERLGRESDIAKKALYNKKMQDYAYQVQGALGDYMRSGVAPARPPGGTLAGGVAGVANALGLPGSEAQALAGPAAGAANALGVPVPEMQALAGGGLGGLLRRAGRGAQRIGGPVAGAANALGVPVPEMQALAGPVAQGGAGVGGALGLPINEVSAMIQAAMQPGAGTPGPNLPTPPEAPQLSLYGRERPGLFNKVVQDTIRGMGMEPRGTTADDVAETFNRAISLLPKAFRPERQVLSGAAPGLRRAAAATNKANVADQNAMFEAMIPYWARQRAGATPAKDVIQQRLLPMYASGAFGQQGMPSAYPNRNALAAVFGG